MTAQAHRSHFGTDTACRASQSPNPIRIHSPQEVARRIAKAEARRLRRLVARDYARTTCIVSLVALVAISLGLFLAHLLGPLFL